MDVLKTIKNLLAIEEDDESYDTVINIHIYNLTQIILNFCKIDTLPEQLKPVLVTKIIEHMRDTEDFRQAVKTSFGDTAITYNDTAITDSVLEDATNQLKRFRKLYAST